MRVAAYFRVSTDKQDFAIQEAVVNKWIQDHAFKIEKTHFFQDFAMSGAKSDRPAYEKMLKLAYAKKIDTIIVYKLDRLSRSASEAIQLFLHLDKLNVNLICITQPILSTVDNPFRRTIFSAFAEIAEIERSIMIGRIRDGVRAAKLRGVQFGRRPKLNAKMIMQIKKMRKLGHTYREISKELHVSIGLVHKVVGARNESKRSVA